MSSTRAPVPETGSPSGGRDANIVGRCGPTEGERDSAGKTWEKEGRPGPQLQLRFIIGPISSGIHAQASAGRFTLPDSMGRNPAGQTFRGTERL